MNYKKKYLKYKNKYLLLKKQLGGNPITLLRKQKMDLTDEELQDVVLHCYNSMSTLGICAAGID